MYIKKYSIELFENAEKFILELPEKDRSTILANIKIMETDFSVVNTKILKSPIRELKVKSFRILFFIHKNKIYFISGFNKKSQKTPKTEIENAINIYKKFKK